MVRRAAACPRSHFRPRWRRQRLALVVGRLAAARRPAQAARADAPPRRAR